MPDPINITPDPLPGEPQLSPAGGPGTVEPNPQPVVTPAPSASLTLEQINTAMGKDFKDIDTALKSWKDTNAFVGRRKEDIAQELMAGNSETARQISEIKENMFFKDNPEYAPYRAAMAKMGSNPEVVAQMPEFKTIFEKAKGFDESQSQRSVLTSNPRLAASKDSITKAKEAVAAGNQEAAASLATQAVLESLQ